MAPAKPGRVRTHFSLLNSLIIFAFLSALLASCTDQKVKNHSEQLPNPGFKTKPQIYFVFNSELTPFNRPHPEELSIKLNAHVEVFSHHDSQKIEEAIRKFNARPSDILLVGPLKLSDQKIDALISHPQRKLSLRLVTEPSKYSKSDTKTVLLDLKGIQKSFGPLESELSAFTPGNDNLVGWSSVDSKFLVNASVDWAAWGKQTLVLVSYDIPPPGRAIWKNISVANNSIELSTNTNALLKSKVDNTAITKKLSEFKMNSLMNKNSIED